MWLPDCAASRPWLLRESGIPHFFSPTPRALTIPTPHATCTGRGRGGRQVAPHAAVHRGLHQLSQGLAHPPRRCEYAAGPRGRASRQVRQGDTELGRGGPDALALGPHPLPPQDPAHIVCGVVPCSRLYGWIGKQILLDIDAQGHPYEGGGQAGPGDVHSVLGASCQGDGGGGGKCRCSARTVDGRWAPRCTRPGVPRSRCKPSAGWITTYGSGEYQDWPPVIEAILELIHDPDGYGACIWEFRERAWGRRAPALCEQSRRMGGQLVT